MVFVQVLFSVSCVIAGHEGVRSVHPVLVTATQLRVPYCRPESTPPRAGGRVSVNSRRLQTSNASIMENETTSKQATTQNKTSEKERADSNNKQHQVIIGTLAQLASKCQHTTKGCQHIPLRRLCSGPARDALDCLILPCQSRMWETTLSRGTWLAWDGGCRER
jgi:hypothetical protein